MEFKARSYDFFDPVESVWAIAEMTTCVAGSRLDRVRVNGRYQRCHLRASDLHRVRQATVCALGLQEWHDTEVSIKIDLVKQMLLNVEVTAEGID